MTVNRQVCLAAHPDGAPELEDFEIVESDVPELEGDQVLCRTLYLSLDPYMRGRMSTAASYAKGTELGGVLPGGCVARVEESRSPEYRAGDIVFVYSGWQDYAVHKPKALRKLDPEAAPISTALGVLGMPGLTAYYGFLKVGLPQPGETVVVAAAAGAVGSIVGQLAKMQGCRAVGIASSPEKCTHVVKDLGFDACVSHRSPELAEELAEVCPDGIDVYFENVGGPVFEAVLPLMNKYGRIPVCGLIAHYNATSLPEGPNRIPLVMRTILTKQLRVQGFIVFDLEDYEAEFLANMTAWVRDEKIRYREDIVEGLENAPKAFCGLLEGANLGKQIVHVSD